MTVTEMPQYTQNKTAVDTSVKISGNLDADKVKMSVSNEGAAHIMSLLTDLYSDPNLAVLREYTSNAVDSHKESGQTRPVEVTLPSHLSSNFIVQDFGTGMSTADIRDIYSSYGKSTKQRDFNQIGAFGLGCKSALTLTQQFTLNSVKNGQKTVAIISRGEDGVGEVNIASSTSTTEPNGVRVTIPIPRPYDFLSKVKDFFYTWEKGTVLVDGKEPASLESDGYVKSKSGMFWYAFNSTIKYTNGSRGFNVILGGISYPISFTDVWGYDSYGGDAATPRATANLGSFYIEVPIGSVDLTPSREGLRYSPRTVKFLKELTKNVSNEVFKMSSEEIENAPTRRDALIAAHRFSHYRRQFPRAPKAVWKGEDVPSQIPVSAMQITANPGYARAKTSKYQVTYIQLSDHLQEKSETIIVKVLDAAESGRIGRNAYDYMQHVTTNPENLAIYATETDIDSPWILETGFAKFVSYDDFLEGAREFRKANRDTTPREKAAPITYKVVGRTTDNNGKSTFTYDSVKPAEISSKAMYVKSADAGQDGNRVFRNLINNTAISNLSKEFSSIWKVLGLDDSDQIVILEKNKTVEALNKRVKSELRYFIDVLKESFEKFKSSMDYSDRYFYGIMGNNSSMSNRIINDLRALERSKSEIPDPDIVDILKKYHQVKDLSETLTAYGHFVSLWGMERAETPEEEKIQTSINRTLGDIARRYPLLAIGQYYGNDGLDKNLDHVMLYMKAVQQDLNERKS